VLPSASEPGGAAPVVDDPEAQALVEPGPELERSRVAGVVTRRIVGELLDGNLSEQEGQRVVVVDRLQVETVPACHLGDHPAAHALDIREHGDHLAVADDLEVPDLRQQAGVRLPVQLGGAAPACRRAH